jgi:hypothetical protein
MYINLHRSWSVTSINALCQLCAHGATRSLSMGPSAKYISDLTISIFSKVFMLFNMISIFIIVATIGINCSSHYCTKLN